jgi:long-chain acyl-CoA synthetase
MEIINGGTIGVPMPSTNLAIFDDDGNQLKQGEVGEICAQGPQVMRGYWNQDNTGVFFPGEWFRTGDIGLMDEDGYFKIVDRKKDMIKVSGFNVYPNEIEGVLSKHPKVLGSCRYWYSRCSIRAKPLKPLL